MLREPIFSCKDIATCYFFYVMRVANAYRIYYSEFQYAVYYINGVRLHHPIYYLVA